MRRFLLTAATAASALLAVAGCSDVTGLRSVEGTYELRTVNGLSLPVALDDGVTVFAGVIELNSDGRFVDTFQFRDDFSGDPRIRTIDTRGTWTRSGNEIEFETDDGDFYTMTWSNGRLIQDTDAGNRYVYQRVR